MPKTYSVAILNKQNVWITNWGQYNFLEEIDWTKVEEHCKERGCLAYGYYHGENSRNLVSARNRKVVKVL